MSMWPDGKRRRKSQCEGIRTVILLSQGRQTPATTAGKIPKMRSGASALLLSSMQRIVGSLVTVAVQQKWILLVCAAH